jgi:hypothetical protein
MLTNPNPDPNALLEKIRHHSTEAANGRDVRRNERELRWAVEELDRWLMRGGDLPHEWWPDDLQLGS